MKYIISKAHDCETSVGTLFTRMYWSVALGWINDEQLASVFSEEERDECRFPVDGDWEEHMPSPLPDVAI